MSPIDGTTVMYLLAAILVAVAIRLYDAPKTELVDPETKKILWGNIVPVLVGAAIACPLGAWILGLNVFEPAGFVAIVAVGILGLSAIKAFLNIKSPE